MDIKAYAKINLYLDSIGKRADGYHELVTVMQRIDLFDEISLEKADDIRVSCDAADVPDGEGNIAFRAARLFFERAGISGGAHIHIRKNIPSKAGLGGGSADGAAVLMGLDELYGTALGENALIKAGAAAGADVPFCIKGGRALCTGIGDKMQPLPSERLFLCVAKGEEGVSTAEAYKAVDSLPKRHHMSPGEIKGLYERGTLFLYNIFEEPCAPPEDRRVIRECISRLGGSPLMSGSGSAFFGIFKCMDSAEKAAAELAERGYFARAVTTAV